MQFYDEPVAHGPMRSINDQQDWSSWQVSLHDLSGRRVLVRSSTAHVGELSRAA
uniref:hypothetical protein n=1 Tax=Methylobacterium sp. B34 TaxID=95563 RepID=UPI0003478625|nr:hypothetical protein [Methylobacterium sp. B34]